MHTGTQIDERLCAT